MPWSPTAGAQWTLVAPPVYQWFWFAAPPSVPGQPPPGGGPPPVVVPPPPTGGPGGVPGTPPPVAPGAPSGIPSPILGPLGLPIFVQADRHPVFLRPKPTYRPIANWWDVCLRYERANWKLARPYLDCQMLWREPDDLDEAAFLSDTWSVTPPDWVVFNPVHALPIPAAAAGEVAIFEVLVPTGYDGIVLAHFHCVSLPAGFQFLEGSGDLAWRLSTNGRFLRNKGNMLTQHGESRFYHPIAGGELVRSDSILRYTVSAPNVSGALPAAGGIILAGLHGWFYPRGGGRE